jgi:hypothetical protein
LLDESDAKQFDQPYNAKATHTGSFATSFGPEHILSSIDEFLGYFLVRKVIAGKALLRTAGDDDKRACCVTLERGRDDSKSVFARGFAARNQDDCNA